MKKYSSQGKKKHPAYNKESGLVTSYADTAF